MDITRRLIAEKKELSEICEIIMDKCLAPDSDINGGVGCDNMTVVIVGLLRGRSKDEWYNWIAERVEKKVGYETPVELPQLYSAARIAAAKDRWSAPNNRFGGGNMSRPGQSGFGTLARVFGSNVMFHPAGGLSNNMLFDQDDSSEEYESEDGEHDAAHEAAGNSNFHGALRAPTETDPNEALREQLKVIKDGESSSSDDTAEKKWTIDDDGDSNMSDTSDANGIQKSAIFNRRAGKATTGGTETTSDAAESESTTKSPMGLASAPPVSIGSPLVPSHSSIRSTPSPSTTGKELQGEAPPPPKVNGTSVKSDGTISPVKQLESQPLGDKPVVDSILDKSEDPLVAAK